MIEFSVDGKSYRADKLDCFKQWDLTRKLLPVVGASADVLVKLFRGGGKGSAPLTLEAVLGGGVSDVISPLARALAALPDADSDYILKTCLRAVQRRADSGSWSPLMTAGGMLAFQLDVQMPQMLQIVWAVIEDNLLSFTPAPPAPST